MTNPQVVQLAEAALEVARQLNKLGLNQASTDLGAIEVLAQEVRGVAAALDSIADAIRYHADTTL